MMAKKWYVVMTGRADVLEFSTLRECATNWGLQGQFGERIESGVYRNSTFGPSGESIDVLFVRADKLQNYPAVAA
jgi:hypothetical protein